MARAPVSKTGGWGFESPPLLPGETRLGQTEPRKIREEYAHE